jgi:hypothetical protein
MGAIEKLKLLFKAWKPAGEFINEVKGARKKYKTIPFWVSILGSGVAIVGALQGVIPATAAVVATATLTGLYNIVRGLDKADQEGTKPALATTEFWIGVLGIVSAQIVDVQTAGVNNAALVTAQSVIAAAMAAAQSLAANQPKDQPKP